MENNQNGESQDNLTFEKLTPTHLSNDEMKGYTEALDFVFKEDDLLNIAITGPYASGKSSVIKTYEENHQELNGIHISLSYFSPILESKIKGKKKDDELAFEDELMLERKIINQLVHQIDPDKIPATEFKVTSETKKITRIMLSGIVSLFILYILFKSETWFMEISNAHPLIFVPLLGVFILCILYYLFRLQSGKNIIGKLKIFENEIDISPSKCDVSYFDKYLNEIIYILDKSELDYIVFEDIDRYDDNLILNKLRELNYTYNKKQIKNKPKQIKFLFLIKDEIFESKERTKFFDYILPIVPVMDNSNSLGKMEIIFKDKNILDDFSATFLHTLSLYLDDIRLIKNICNEYNIYKSKLAHDASWFNKEKLLAIIVYKNIFPKDFSLTRLGLGQGVVHRVISSLLKQKSETYKTKINNINNEIESLKHQISIIETSHLKNQDELEALYINISKNADVQDYRYIEGKDIFSLNRLEFILLLKKNNWLVGNRNNNNDYYYREKSYKEYFQQLETNTEYQERKKEIEIVVRNKKTTLEAEIKKLEKEKTQSKLPKKITEIIRFSQKNGTSIESLFEKHIENNKEYKSDYEQVSSSCYFPLIRVLIIQGYIDEYYSDYTTFFDEQGLPQNDTLFLRNINERLDTPWDLELKKPDIVFKKLKIEASTNFTESTILNYSLLDYLLATNKTDDLSRFIHLLNLRTEADFENEYLARSYALLSNKENQYDQKYLCLFITELNINSPNIWEFINIFDKRLYLYLSFIHNQEMTLKTMNKDHKLKHFIDNSADFLSLDDEWSAIFNLVDDKQIYINKIANAFSILNIKFLQIDDSTPQLLSIVEQNNIYQLNHFNAKYILENKYHLNDFDSHIIQTVLELEDDAPVKVYFQNNPEEFLLSVTQSTLTKIDDNAETVIYVLNNNKIFSSTKASYINKLSTIIQKLSSITDSILWNELLESQRIEYSAENIVFYFFNYTLEQKEIEDEDDDENDIEYEERKINQQLLNFINNNLKNITSREANLNKLITDEDEISLFFNNVTTHLDLDNQKYEMLISWFNGRNYFNFNYKNIDKEKISILIQYKAIRLTEKQDLNFIRENYPDNILELITLNFDDYVNKLKNNNSSIKHDEIVRLLSEKFTLTQKNLLLSLTKETISIKYSEYPEDIQKYIFENNFDFDDLAYITNYSYYNSVSYDIKTKVKELCVEHKTQTLKIDKICYELLIELFTFEDFSLEDKYILLTNQINHLELEQTYACFEMLENEPTNNEMFSRLFIGKNPRFEITPLNTNMMTELRNRWKFFYRTDKGKIITSGKKLIKL